MAKKKEIPDSIKDLVLSESNFQCAYCGHRDGLNLTCHHLVQRKDKGENSYNNLIALCYNCHNGIHDSESIKEKDIRRIKRSLVENFLTPIGVNVLKIAYKYKDGLVESPSSMVLHLVERKLLKVNRKIVYGLAFMSQLEITSDGKELVELWLKTG